MRINTLTVEHPRLTVGQVLRLGSQHAERSGHVGNQNLTELTLLTNVKDLQPILVDTIHGRDSYSQPRLLQVAGEEYHLASQSQSNNRVVGAIAISGGLDQAANRHAGLKSLRGNRTLASLHQASVDAIKLAAKPPMLLSQVLRNAGDAGRALMEQLAESGGLSRQVESNGRIRTQPIDAAALKRLGVFGLADETGPHTGVMLPLTGMMALDILSSLRAGRDTVHHLAGRDMRLYTKDAAVMQPVEIAVSGTLERLGRKTVRSRYVVIDISNIHAAASTEQKAVQSQYDLIATHDAKVARQIIIPARNYGMPAFTK